VGISVFVMPLRTWLSGDFRTTWAGGEVGGPPRRRRPLEAAERLRDEFLSRMESLLGRRPEWDESGPVLSATTFSAHAFSLPFLQARRWAYKMKVPQLNVLEATQLWIPSAFDQVLTVSSLWSDEGEVMVGSLPRLKSELDTLLQALEGEEAGDWAELREVSKAARSIREAVSTALDHRVPVIVEG
jgi:hypothetical protein